MRLIDADKLFKWYTGQRTKYPVGKDPEQYRTLMMYEIFDEIDTAPTVDPVIHAYWRDTKFSYGECSECGEWTDHYTTARYCVHCGAKMDVVKV